MQSITVTFPQRIILWNMVGNHNATSLKDASIYLRILDKVRLTDQEQVETGFTIVGQQYSWQQMPNGYGTRDVNLEVDETAALAAAIETATPVRVADAAWLVNLVFQLRHPKLELVTNPA
jgi:hypothetical protein